MVARAGLAGSMEEAYAVASPSWPAVALEVTQLEAPGGGLDPGEAATSTSSPLGSVQQLLPGLWEVSTPPMSPPD